MHFFYVFFTYKNIGLCSQKKKTTDSAHIKKTKGLCSQKQTKDFAHFMKEWQVILRNEYGTTDPDLQFSLEQIACPAKVCTTAFQKQFFWSYINRGAYQERHLIYYYIIFFLKMINKEYIKPFIKVFKKYMII